MKKNPFLYVILALVFAFILSPFVVIFVVSFAHSLAFPPTGFTVKWYAKVVQMPMFRNAFVTSLIVGLGATTAALLFGIPGAYAIVRFMFKGRDSVEFSLTSPMVVPALVIGFALMRYLIYIGRLPVLPTLFVGHTVLLFPYAVRVTAASLRNFDFRTEEAAISLGAPQWKAFFRVVLPNIRTGVLAAFILGFTMSFNNVPISLFLTGPGVSTLPIQMLIYMQYYYDPLIAALSVLLILFTVLITQGAEAALGLSRYV
jgi:putative spermidine/putrescine transport system permease protein